MIRHQSDPGAILQTLRWGVVFRMQTRPSRWFLQSGRSL